MVNSCNGQTETCELNYINDIDKLSLTQRNDKCGEWGGDTKEIVIFRTDFTGQLFATIKHTVKLCPPVEDEFENFQKENIKVTKEQQCLIFETIDELSKSKLSRPNFPSHAGYYNQIVLSDSSFVLDDFPSIKWRTFDELFEALTK